MNWNNLKSNKCPQCGTYLTKAPYITNTQSSCGNCSFKISGEKFNSIVSKMYLNQKSIDLRKNDIDSNLEALNNLGHAPISEDFSDSKFLNY